MDKFVKFHVKFSHDLTSQKSLPSANFDRVIFKNGWLGSRVVSVLDSGAEGPGFKSQSRRFRLIVLRKLFTPIVPLFTKQQNLRVAGVTAGLAESIGGLPPGL